jgi:hypothetical protein
MCQDYLSLAIKETWEGREENKKEEIFEMWKTLDAAPKAKRRRQWGQQNLLWI